MVAANLQHEGHPALLDYRQLDALVGQDLSSPRGVMQWDIIHDGSEQVSCLDRLADGQETAQLASPDTPSLHGPTPNGETLAFSLALPMRMIFVSLSTAAS